MLTYLQSATGSLPFFMTLSSDHITGATSATPTVTLSKNCGPFAAASGTVVEIGSGWYNLRANAVDLNTKGPLVLHAAAASCDPDDRSFAVVGYDPNDSVRLGLTALPNAAAEALGGLYTRGGGTGQIAQNVTGSIVSDIRYVNSNAASGVTGSIPASVTAIATGLITSGTITPLGLTSISTNILSSIVDNTLTLSQFLRIIGALAGGQTTGGGTTTIVFKALNDNATTRITATVDSSGNRSAITLNA